jgi:hypothetical protein
MGIWDDYQDNGKKGGALYILLIALILFFSLMFYRAYDLKRREIDLKLRLSESRLGSMEVGAHIPFSIRFLSADPVRFLASPHSPQDPLSPPL